MVQLRFGVNHHLKAVVLAAGEGSRLRPLTTSRPKPMIPIAGRPLLEHLLLSIKESGIKQVLLVVGYHSEMIESYFKDGKEFGLRLTYVRQEKPLGTANAVKMAERYVDEDYFLAVYGDLFIHSSSIKSLIQKHSKKKVARMVVVPVKNPQRFGVVRLVDCFVRGLIEKPKPGEAFSSLANAGIYIFPREIFKEISKTKASSRAEFELTDTILNLIESDKQILAEVIDPKSWNDLGRPWDLFEINGRALENSKFEVKGTVESGVHIAGNVGVGEGALVRSGTYIEGPVIIGSGSDVGPNCRIRPFTSLGKDVRVGNACEVKASLIFDKTQIGHLSYVGDSIIGENCNLGAGTITANLRFDDDTVKVMVKSELVDSGLRKLGTIMGDNVKTGVGVSIMPGVKIGANARIGPDITVYRDVEENAFIVGKKSL